MSKAKPDQEDFYKEAILPEVDPKRANRKQRRARQLAELERAQSQEHQPTADQPTPLESDQTKATPVAEELPFQPEEIPVESAQPPQQKEQQKPGAKRSDPEPTKTPAFSMSKLGDGVSISDSEIAAITDE